MNTPTWTDIVQTIVQILALFSGAAAIVAWRRSLQDRAAAVLIELEERFNDDAILAGRGLLEDQADYERLVDAMHIALEETARNETKDAQTPAKATKLTSEQGEMLEQLDALLRFYVLLRGIRKAQQVPDESLRLCYAYWLNFYFSTKRTEFARYVNTYFGGLKKWIDEDQAVPSHERFFRPNWNRSAGPSIPSK